MAAPPKPCTLLGTVTRVGPRSYAARVFSGPGSVGKNIGTFVSTRDAEAAVERAFGARFLNWIREDRQDGVETYRAQTGNCP